MNVPNLSQIATVFSHMFNVVWIMNATMTFYLASQPTKCSSFAIFVLAIGTPHLVTPINLVDTSSAARARFRFLEDGFHALNVLFLAFMSSNLVLCFSFHHVALGTDVNFANPANAFL